MMLFSENFSGSAIIISLHVQHEAGKNYFLFPEQLQNKRGEKLNSPKKKCLIKRREMLIKLDVYKRVDLNWRRLFAKQQQEAPEKREKE
jgi:hypothetical protein